MSGTLVSDVSAQVQTFWSPMFVPELLESSVLPALVDRKYEGELKAMGDTVKVSQIVRPTATRKTVGANHETFETGTLQTNSISIVADQVISAGFKFDDLVALQSQIRDKDSEIRKALMEAYMIELNNYLYSLVSPSTASPDHSIASVSDFNTSQILANRLLASQAKWPEADRYCVLDPSYYNDVLATGVLTSSDYVGDDAPVINGKVLKQRFGFWIVEDNSAGLLTISPTTGNTADCGLLFTPGFMHLVQGEPEFKISDLHSNNIFGYQITVKVVVGAKLGISGNVKHIKVYNT